MVRRRAPATRQPAAPPTITSGRPPHPPPQATDVPRPHLPATASRPPRPRRPVAAEPPVPVVPRYARRAPAATSAQPRVGPRVAGRGAGEAAGLPAAPRNVPRRIRPAWLALQQSQRGPAPFADCGWIARLTVAPIVTSLRPDARHHRLTIARFIKACADWRTLRSRPTLARIIAHPADLALGQADEPGRCQGLSERCVQYHCRALEDDGWLAVLDPGTTSEFRPWALHAGEPNLAREWRPTVGHKSSCTPPRPPSG